MKYIYACIMLLAGSLLSGCTTTNQAVVPDGTTRQATYAIYGMDCPGCHGGVEKNLRKIPGVVDASANWKNKTITLALTADHPIDHAAIEKAVRDSNFTLGERVE